MPLIDILIVLTVIGILLWLVERYIPMEQKIKSILNGVVAIAVALWVLNALGLFDSISTLNLGSL